MLTLKFALHSSPESYIVYACEKYTVTTEPEKSKGKRSGPYRRIVRMWRSQADENPYYETLGPQEPYGMCYVMNDVGKTVDKIFG